MDELKQEYTVLFNGITETIGQLESMVQRLRLLQQAAENAYMERHDESAPAKEKEKLVVLEASG